MGKPTHSKPYIGTRNGRYYAFWYDPAARRTRRASLGTAAAGEAGEAFSRFIVGREIQPERHERVTVKAALNAYLQEHVAENCSDPGRQEDAAKHLIEFGGSDLLSNVDIPWSRAYASARRAGKVGGGKRRANKAGTDSTIRRELVVLIAAANHMRKWRRISQAEMPSVEKPVDKSQCRGLSFDGQAAYFSKSQVASLIAVAPEPVGAMTRLMYHTGARRRAIEHLTAEQVDLAGGRIALATPGKRYTKKRQPIVPIFDAIRPDLERLLAVREKGRLFPPMSFHREFTKVCRKLNLPQPHHPHLLRHSRATHLLVDGKDPYAVAKLLGDDLITVLRTYGHHLPDDLKGKLE